MYLCDDIIYRTAGRQHGKNELILVDVALDEVRAVGFESAGERLIQAVDGIEGKKRLVVSLRNAVEDGFYDIVVEDNGPGVDAANQDKIFTPDFTTKTSGSGLGLAICKRIVEHCGGSISYSKSFNLGGACFTVKYPKA